MSASSAGADAKTERQRRLAAALRSNLKRRKEQARGRTAAPAFGPDAESDTDRTDSSPAAAGRPGRKDGA